MGLPIVHDAPPKPILGPRQRALDALWGEIAQRPLWAPPHLLRYLRLRARMRLRLLDPAKTTLVTPKGQINDCGSCSDSCCIGPRNTVLLGLRDIAMLLDIGRPELMVHRKPVFTPEQLAQRPALARHVRSETWRRFPVLAQNDFGACLALDLSGRCSLHPHWPQSCARFPFSLHLETSEVFFSRRCRSFFIHPSAAKKAERIQLAAVASYNERIKDAVLLAYAPERLTALGLMGYVRPSQA
jgi:Fe-S-cluster containining protein